MRGLWILALGLVALTATQGCKQKEPEPLPGPKVGGPAAPDTARTPGIAWFQGSFDEAFAAAEMPRSCRDYSPIAPRTPDLARVRKRSNSPSPGMCGIELCPPTPAVRPRHRLV
jgi:hypothetical protein